VAFFNWYNDEHQHSGLNGYIPADVYYGRAAAITVIKQTALDEAYARHSERFVNGAPNAKSPPETVYINQLPATVLELPAKSQHQEIDPNAPTENESQLSN